MSGEQNEFNFTSSEEEEVFQFQSNSNQNYDDDDLKNLEEIEQEMSRLNNDNNNETGNLEEEDDIMDELEAEIQRTECASPLSPSSNGPNTSNSGRSYLPVGATPSRNGVLSPHAAEFWFPECRNCPCCKGFRHGCACRSKGVDTCIAPTCTTSTESSESTVAASAITTSSAPSDTKSSSTVSTAAKQGSYLPPGAVPSQNGVLSPQAAEFWFPECRDCACCKGFKHGCSCRANGITVCQSCCTGQFIAPLAQPITPKGSGSEAAGAISPPGALSEQCKFFASGNCRFGATCRFIHIGTGGNSPGNFNQAPSPKSAGCGPSQVCTFFMQGRCQFGDSCKNIHPTA